MTDPANPPSQGELSAEIAADDAGASAAAERLQKIQDQPDRSARTTIGGVIASDHQQMDRSDDPVETARMDVEAAANALSSRHEGLAGSAVGTGRGTLGFADPGAFPRAAQEEDPRGELLFDGQEEVFSRTEVESGHVEHHVGEENMEGADRPQAATGQKKDPSR